MTYRNFYLLLILLTIGELQTVSGRLHHHGYNKYSETFEPTPKLNSETDSVVRNGNSISQQGVAAFQEKYLVLDAATGIRYNPYSKHHPGRHVCGSQKMLQLPEKKRPLSKPSRRENCENLRSCAGYRLFNARLDMDSKASKQIVYECCPGWAQISNKSYGCNKPVCSPGCQNGGTCVKPSVCSCSAGFTGQGCETDINECETRKPCDQICYNTAGSFTCHCKENFSLQPVDYRARKKDDNLAIESDHFEYLILEERLLKLESIINSTTYNMLLKDIEHTNSKLIDEISEMKKKIMDVETIYIRNFSQLKTRLCKVEKNSDYLLKKDNARKLNIINSKRECE